MQKLTLLTATALAAFLLAGPVAVAEPESTLGLAPSASPQLQPDAPSAPPSSAPTDSPLIPQIVPGVTGKAQYKNMNKTEVSEDKLKKLVQWRVATAKAERDPNLQAIKARALVAKTDFEQRKIFIDYYNGLFDLIAKIDPTLTKEEVAQKKAIYASRFVQGRVAPTIDPAIARAARN
jgi:hypothetical protein